MNQPIDKYRSTQDAFAVIDRIAPILSISALDEKNKTVINEILNDLLLSVIKPAVVQTKATASGIIT